MRITHPDRVLYPTQGATKRDLARYYEAVAESDPAARRRPPDALVRCPEGVGEDVLLPEAPGLSVPEAAAA